MQHTGYYIHYSGVRSRKRRLKKPWSCSVFLFLTIRIFPCDFQVKVSFRCSLSLLDHAEQTVEELPPGVTLMHRPRGGRKLRLQQNLLIHYSNNSLQVTRGHFRNVSKGKNIRQCVMMCVDLSHLFCADGASLCRFGSRFDASVQRLHRLWDLPHRADADIRRHSAKPRSADLLESSDR